MKIKELREMTEMELVERLENLNDLLFKRRFESHDDQAKNPGEVRTARKDIARIKTLLKERNYTPVKVKKEAAADSGETAGEPVETETGPTADESVEEAGREQ